MTLETEDGRVWQPEGLLPNARRSDARGRQDGAQGAANRPRVPMSAVWNMAPDEPTEEGGLSSDSVSPETSHLAETSVGDPAKANPPVNFIAMAYRWGDENGHWYFIYCGGDFQKAYAMARAENADRGGKYACAVYGFPPNGCDAELMCYFPSSMEEDDATGPRHNHRKDFFERLGIFAHDAARGACLMPTISDPNRLTYRQVDCPQFLKDEVERQRQVYQAFVDVDEQRAERAAKLKNS